MPRIPTIRLLDLSKTNNAWNMKNVRIFLDPSKLTQVAREMDTNNLEILELAETRWHGSEDEQLQSSHYFMLSGMNAERGNNIGTKHYCLILLKILQHQSSSMLRSYGCC